MLLFTSFTKSPVLQEPLPHPLQFQDSVTTTLSLHHIHKLDRIIHQPHTDLIDKKLNPKADSSTEYLVTGLLEFCNPPLSSNLVFSIRYFINAVHLQPLVSDYHLLNI